MVRPVMTEETISALEDLAGQYFEVPAEAVSYEQQLSVLIEKHQELEDRVENLQNQNERLKRENSKTTDTRAFSP